MKTKSSNHRAVTLPHLLELYNDGKISVNEFTEQAVPLLVQQRRKNIFLFALQLVADDADRYHINRPDHGKLWEHAESAYEARMEAELAERPSLWSKLEETVRRVQAEWNLPGHESGDI